MAADASRESQVGGLAEAVRAAERAARRRERWLDEVEHAANQSPREWAGFLFWRALNWSRWWRRYLRRRFGCDAPNYRFVDLRRIPRSDREWRSFTRALHAWRLCIVILGAMSDGWRQAEEQGDDPALQAVRAHFDVHRTAPSRVAVDMAIAPSPALRQEAAIQLGGWLATKISPRFPRLRDQLGGGSPHELHRALLEGLPGAALQAFHDLDPNEDPLVLRSHASTILAGGGQRRRKRRPPSALGRPTRFDEARGVLDIDPRRMIQVMMAESPTRRAWLTELDRRVREEVGRPLVEVAADAVSGRSSVDAGLQDFEMREAVHTADSVDDFDLREAVKALAAERGWSEREAEVAYLRSQGWSHQGIAERLGIDVDTSRVYLHRARRKAKSTV